MNGRGKIPLWIWTGFLICGFQNSFISSGFTQTENASNGKPWSFWGEFYDESTSSQKIQDNLISFSHVRQGLRKPLSSSLSLEAYLFVRYGKDLHRDYWNNRLEGGPGCRLRFSRKIFLAYYMEVIQGAYLNVRGENSESVSKKYDDFRTGLIFWYGWDKYRDPVRRFTFTADRWGEVYSDISYYRKERKNTIGYAHVKTGIHTLRFWMTTFDVYGVLYVNKDVKNDFWNNKAEFGPAVWMRPWEGLECQLYVEWLNGYYYGIEGHDPNPYPQKYHDRRMGVLFWMGW